MNADVIIVGAGVCGLIAGTILQEHAVDFLILDKDKQVGGRLATLEIEGGLADTGAQFFSVRDNRFSPYVEQWKAAGLIYQWSNGWSDGSLKRTLPDKHPRYAVKGGMRRLAQYLAESLGDRVRVNASVYLLTPTDNGWTLEDGAENIYHGRAVLLTAPVPQALTLLYESGVPVAEVDRRELERIQFGPCLCGVFVVNGAVDLPEPGALQQPAHNFAWIADNQRKGLSPDVRILTVHAAPNYSREHWDTPDEIVLDALQTSFADRLVKDASVARRLLHRWEYSVPLTTHPEYYHLLANLPTMLLAGDAFGGRGRVEGAALSGLAAGRALIERLA